MAESPDIVSDLPRLPPRPPTMHKGQAGHVAIVAGSPGMTGAAVLAGLGALRAGAGLVRVLTGESVQPIVAASEPCLMTVPLPEDADHDLRADAFPAADVQGWANAAAIGPGMGQKPGICGSVWAMLCDTSVPLVVDADALNVLARPDLWPPALSGDESRWWTHCSAERPIVMTPHPGEMARLRTAAGLDPLRGNDDQTRLRIAHEYATLTGATVVLKGHRTVVCTREQAFINMTGNAGMATGGMGDVLTGLIAGLLAQGLAPFDAARLGVYVHGLAADYCAKQIAPAGYLARDVADALPAALAETARPRIGFR